MSTTSKPQAPVKIFVSYSHKDERLKDKLLAHLSPLRRQEIIECWHDRQIKAGDRWNEELLKHFDEAHIILCLISSDFFNSDYCYLIETPRALERQAAGKLHVIPVLLRSVVWEATPFRHLQAIPRDDRPIADQANKDKILKEVAKEINKVIDDILAKGKQ